MKKFLGIFVAAMLVIGFASQAPAYFEEQQFMRFVFQSGSAPNEWGTDLGVQAKASQAIAGGSWTLGNVGDMLAASNFDDFSKLKVSYWAKENVNTVPGQYWISGFYNDGDGLTLMQWSGSTLNTVTDKVVGKYDDSTTSTMMVPKSDLFSNFKNIEISDPNMGGFANRLMVPPGREATISLSALTGSKHEVMSSLYYFNVTAIPGAVQGNLVAFIRTYMTAGADGDYATLGDNFIGTEIKAVPVPAAVWLLGSGLLGLFGIRRKSISKHFV